MNNRLYKNLFGLISLVLLLSPAINAAGPAAVNLGSSGSFAILAKSGISTTGTTSIVGDIGVSPISSTAITGFGLILDTSNQFATSSLVNGKAYAADYAPPTPTKMTTAVSDMQTAYTDAAGRTNPTATELGAGNIGGMTIAPGLYKWSTGVTVPTSVTLSGGPNDVWIFQIAQTLNVGNGAIVTLSGGAQAKNIFWQVAGQATLGTTSDVKGIILSQTAIVMNNGAKLNGRALAQTAVTLIADTVTAPTGSATPAPTPAPASTGTTPVSTPTSTPSQNPPVSPGSSGPTGPGGSSGPIGTNYTGSSTTQNTNCYWDSNLGYSKCSAATTSVNQPLTPTQTPTPKPSPAATPIGTSSTQRASTNQTSTPTPAPTSTGTTTPTPTTPQPTTTPTPSPSIIQTPVPQPSVSSSQSQIAQNLACGLPAGLVR